MLGPSVKTLLDLHTDIRRKVDDGEYILEVDEMPPSTGLSAEIAMQRLHSREIMVGPAKTAAPAAG